MREVPAGVSKRTNKPYPAFFACDKDACKEAKKASRPSTFDQFTITELQAAIGNMRVWAKKVEERLDNLEKNV